MRSCVADPRAYSFGASGLQSAYQRTQSVLAAGIRPLSPVAGPREFAPSWSAARGARLETVRGERAQHANFRKISRHTPCIVRSRNVRLGFRLRAYAQAKRWSE